MASHPFWQARAAMLFATCPKPTYPPIVHQISERQPSAARIQGISSDDELL